MRKYIAAIPRTLLATLGVVLVAFGFVAVLVSIFSIADPVGAQLSNDADPFGEPPSRLSSALLAVVYAAVTVFGGWLFKRARKARVAQPTLQADRPLTRPPA